MPADDEGKPAPPGQTGLFPRTHWTIVSLAADAGSSEARAALAEFCQSYWYPLYVYLRRNGHRPEEAEDLTQAFFAERILTGLIFRGVDRSHGRFRTWLLNSLQNFVLNQLDKRNAKKRGGGGVHLSIDLRDAEGRYSIEIEDQTTPETLYERAWALSLLEQVLAQLRSRYEQSDRAQFFDAMKCYLPGAATNPPYQETAARLGKSEDSVKMAASRLRREYRKALTDEIERTVSTPAEVQEELRYLMAVLSA